MVAKQALCLRLGGTGDRTGDANAARPQSHLTSTKASLVHVGLLLIVCVCVCQVELKNQADRRNKGPSNRPNMEQLVRVRQDCCL